MINCQIYSAKLNHHVMQLYTGFSMLARQGKIKLTQHFEDFSIVSALSQSMFMVLNQKVIIFYDVNDGPTVDQVVAEQVDFYFKRSYKESAIPEQYKHKVFPLGLNMPVYGGLADRYEFERIFMQGKTYTQNRREIFKYISGCTPFFFKPTVKNMYSAPIYNQEPKVIFMVRTWESTSLPDSLPAEELEYKKKDIENVNETRAIIIRTLRKEMGSRFIGGFAHTPFSIKYYKNELLDSKGISSKKSYMNLLQKCPICIATTGLQGSIGWKVAEYVALSKAIVSEKLNCELPGNFSKDNNYLEFNSAQECIDQTMQLVENKNLMQKLMINNNQYYKEHLVPDQLILRTINAALKQNPNPY